jgi:DNA-binding PadR family transcriptional regulator
VALRHAVLAALLEGEASGYELGKRFDVSVANFWTATSQQLYRELERLEGEGLLRARVVEQERRPNKRLYELTAAGREELAAFTAATPRAPALRDELIVQVQAVDAGHADAVLGALAERIARAREKLDRYDRLRARMLAGRSEEQYLREARAVGPYLTLMGGRMYEQQNIAWASAVTDALHARAAAGGGRSGARPVAADAG